MIARKQQVILLTGFGPFPGAEINASAALVEELGDLISRRFKTKRVITAILPTEWIAAPHRLSRLYAREKPTLCIHFGVSAKARTLVVETRAENHCRPAADASGAMPQSSCIDPDGPVRLNVSLPVGAIVSRLGSIKVPVRLSDDAGSYLCNAVLYRSLQLAAGMEHPATAGFIHMPAVLRPALDRIPRSKTPPVLTWEQAIAGGVEIVRVALGKRPPATARSQG